MKKSIIITLVTLFIGGGLSLYAQKEMDQFEVQVDGLGCPFCAYGLEKKFKELKGIKKVKIDIETGDFSFQYPAEKSLTLEAVEAQVTKAGYTPITTKIVRASGELITNESQNDMAMDAKSLSTGSLFIAGNCGMCKARIEKAAKTIPGVATAAWNQDSKLLEIAYAPTTANLKDVEAAVVKSGHDSKKLSADDTTYESLPGCCHYERVNQ